MSPNLEAGARSAFRAMICLHYMSSDIALFE